MSPACHSERQRRISIENCTSEFFESVGLTISQPKRGYRYGEDSLRLADACRVPKGSSVAELGSGCGVVSLIITARDKPKYIAAVEIQESLHKIAEGNVCANDLGRIVHCFNEDYRKFAARNGGKFDVVVSNPPFYPAGQGRLSPNKERAAAHHELNGDISDLVVAAGRLLKPQGRFYVIFPANRQKELFSAAGPALFTSKF